MATLASLLDSPDVNLAAIETHLDGLDAAARVVECRALGKAQLAKLWGAAAPAGPLKLDDFVGSDGEKVEFAGKNSLPLFTHFEKHFTRQGGEVIGINVGSTQFATGPGYFTCDATAERPSEIRFDYTRVPASAPAGWPTPKSNRGGLSYFVYRDMHDYNRRVAKGVVIGAATRLGTPIDAYYVLARKS